MTEIVSAKYKFLILLYQLGGEASWSEIFYKWRTSEISRYADELIAKGLVTDKWEKTKRIFQLTEKGNALVLKILEIENMVAQ
ncbi:winged helix-turn-helix domain-containing protein [Sulfuracidifex tepidarius]|nr:hypothetical protein [Sulfuracidifex tepidarius]